MIHRMFTLYLKFFDDHVIIDQIGEYRAYEDGLSLKAALYFSKDSSQKKRFSLIFETLIQIFLNIC